MIWDCLKDVYDTLRLATTFWTRSSNGPAIGLRAARNERALLHVFNEPNVSAIL
jgi:hypothetical protein